MQALAAALVDRVLGGAMSIEPAEAPCLECAMRRVLLALGLGVAVVGFGGRDGSWGVEVVLGQWGRVPCGAQSGRGGPVALGHLQCPRPGARRRDAAARSRRVPPLLAAAARRPGRADERMWSKYLRNQGECTYRMRLPGRREGDRAERLVP